MFLCHVVHYWDKNVWMPRVEKNATKKNVSNKKKTMISNHVVCDFCFSVSLRLARLFSRVIYMKIKSKTNGSNSFTRNGAKDGTLFTIVVNLTMSCQSNKTMYFQSNRAREMATSQKSKNTKYLHHNKNMNQFK